MTPQPSQQRLDLIDLIILGNHPECKTVEEAKWKERKIVGCQYMVFKTLHNDHMVNGGIITTRVSSNVSEFRIYGVDYFGDDDNLYFGKVANKNLGLPCTIARVMTALHNKFDPLDRHSDDDGGCVFETIKSNLIIFKDENSYAVEVYFPPTISGVDTHLLSVKNNEFIISENTVKSLLDLLK